VNMREREGGRQRDCEKEGGRVEEREGEVDSERLCERVSESE
jgi:hypothetical protein